jgi:hypothetical protein
LFMRTQDILGLLNHLGTDIGRRCQRQATPGDVLVTVPCIQYDIRFGS